MSKQAHTIHVITGPTASGKTDFALSMAGDMNGVIINADSMQIYDALYILGAHPTAEEQQSCPHKLYAALHPAERCSATRWRDMAATHIKQTLANEQTPILVGGTGFYIKSLSEGLSPIPEIDLSYRNEAEALRKELGPQAFHEALAKLDPETAQRLHPNDTQRLIRAKEVVDATGTPLSEWQKRPLIPAPQDWHFKYHVITKDRAEIIDRINARFDVMMKQGAIDEVQHLANMIDNGEVPEDALIVKAHGFRNLRKYLRGEWSMDEAAEHTKAETRQYAKRQMTWVRGQLPPEHTTYHRL